VLLDNQMVNASVALATTISPLKKHERERKEKKGLKGAERGRNAAALDAAGAGSRRLRQINAARAGVPYVNFYVALHCFL
jgi:hypothetical protein